MESFIRLTVPLYLVVSHYPITQLSRLSVEAMAEQQRPSIPLTPSSPPHLFPSSMRIKEVQHWMKRSGRS